MTHFNPVVKGSCGDSTALRAASLMALISSNFGLFMYAEEIPVLDSSLELSINGASTSGVFGGICLYESGSSAYSGSGVFPFFLNATGANPADYNISLWTNGVENSVLGSTDSMVAYIQFGTDASTFLLITGSGITANALPFDNSPNSFLNRDTADARTLFLLAPGEPLASGVELSDVGGGRTHKPYSPFHPRVLSYATK